MTLFTLHLPEEIRHPFVLNFPHSGTFMPSDIAKQIRPNQLLAMDDTDWYLDRLYDFAFDLGIPVMKANFNRWVVDLNRDPSGKQLYDDGRNITGLVTDIDFSGNSIYRKGVELSEEEILNRKINYYDPYHEKLNEVLKTVKQQFGKVFLWDAHSIRRYVPGIHEKPFPDMILGTNSGKSCTERDEILIYNSLSGAGYDCERNTIFKGGYITRHYGDPENNFFAFQLEMSKNLYMKENESMYDSDKSTKLKQDLKNTIEELLNQI